jgi:hypothetical protein
MITTNQQAGAMRQVITVKQPDGKSTWINAHASAVEETVHGWCKGQHISNVVLAVVWLPKWPDVGTIDRKRAIRHYEFHAR